MILRGLIFDFDGTLADTLPVCYAAFRQVFEAHLGRAFEDGDIAGLFGPSEAGILQRMIPDQWENALDQYLRLYEALQSDLNTEIPGVHSLLSLVTKNQIPMAVVTGKGFESADISLKHLGMDKFFQCVEAGKAGGADKPAAIARVLDRWGVPASEVSYVGDSTYDIRAAKEAGVHSIAACWANQGQEDELIREGPNKLFTRVDRFQHWLIQECNLKPES